MHGVGVLPPDSPQVPPHKPSPNNNVLPPKPPHLASQAAAAASSFRKKPPMPSPPSSSPPSSQKLEQEVRHFRLFVLVRELWRIAQKLLYTFISCLGLHINYFPDPPFSNLILVNTFNLIKLRTNTVGFCLIPTMVLAHTETHTHTLGRCSPIFFHTLTIILKAYEKEFFI